MKRLIVVGAAAAILAVWILAQAAGAARPLPEIVPSGALLYLEAQNFHSLLGDWNSSPEKPAWLASDNYQVFSRSRLFLRLQQAQQEFAEAAGVPPDLALLDGVAGSESALAIYDIGQLQFLYVTRMPEARETASALWKKRGDYRTRTAAGAEYFIKEDPASHRVAAFAAAQDYLLLATREDLLTGALALLAGQGGPAVSHDAWFVDTTRAAGPLKDLRLVMDFDRVSRSPYFRSYWIQRNVSDLRQFRASISSVERTPAEIRENRILLRREPAADRSGDEPATGQLVRLVPADAGLYRAWEGPDADRVLALIRHKLLTPGPDTEVASLQAPAVVLGSGVTGSEEDLETRIDEPPLTDEKGSAELTGLRNLLASRKLEALLEAGGGYAPNGNVFAGTRTLIALLADRDWDSTAARAALTQAAANVWTTSELGAGWTARTFSGREYFELNGLARLEVAANGPVLLLSDSPDLLTDSLARLGVPTGQAAIYEAGYRHAREFSFYERLTRLIDAPGRPADGTGGAQPQFFSDNVASLSRSLARVQAVSLVAHDNGAMLRQSVVYRISP